jgi:hypothetical protein
MRRLAILAILVLASFVLVVEFWPIYIVIWAGSYRGRFTYRVRIIRRPWFAFARSRIGNWQNGTAFRRHEMRYLNSTVIAPYRINVALGGRTSAFCRENARSRSRFLVVVAFWPDGTRDGRLVYIPDDRKSWTVHVSFPKTRGRADRPALCGSSTSIHYRW